ncbi:hypothetical protein L0222_21550 [bacterium]|nr:hypothetical protein [bacterium]
MRKDIAVYNEATGFTIHPAGYCGKSRKEVGDHLYKSVQEALIIPIKLVQDNCPHVRIITGELTPQEEAEWVDRFIWKLRIPCGELVLEGGFDPRGPDETFMRTTPVEPGDYQVEVYTFYWSINGFDTLPEELAEPAGSWFRRTRPGQEFPSTMRFYLEEFPEDDPGHEEERDESYNSEDYEEPEEPDFVDFLVRLTPLKTEPLLECNSDGWFPIGIHPRKVEVCPVGIKFHRTKT